MTIDIKHPCFIDISHWEAVDWSRLPSYVLGMVTKVSQGKSYVDPTARASWIGAGNRKLVRSAFHFFEANDVSSQAANFLTACEDAKIIISGQWTGEMEPVLDAEHSPTSAVSRALGLVGIQTSRLSTRKRLDLEYPDRYLVKTSSPVRTVVSAGVTGAQLAAQYKAWLDLVEAELHVRPIIYTSKWFWIHTGFPAWEANYKLWDAQYPKYPNGQTSPLYFPYGHWSNWWSWQYSADAIMDGVSGKVDVNVFNGSLEDWNAQYGGGIIPPSKRKIVIKIRRN